MTAAGPRPPWSWVAVLAGFALETAAVTGVVVSLVLDAVRAHGRSEARGGFGRDGFLDGLGSFLDVLGAFLVGVLALVLLLALVLSARPGGRRHGGLILGVVLQVPVLWGTIGGIESGVGTGEVTAVAGLALVLVGVVVPATWQFSRLPPLSGTGTQDAVPGTS